MLRPPGLTPACIWLLTGLQSRLLAVTVARGQYACLANLDRGDRICTPALVKAQRTASCGRCCDGLTVLRWHVEIVCEIRTQWATQ